MLDSFKSALKLFSKAHQDMADGFYGTLEHIQREAEEKRAENQKKRERIKEEMDRGGRLTNHRINI